MRHKVAGYKLGRNTATGARCCAIWSLRSSWKSGSKPPWPRRRPLRPHVEKMITLGKKGDLAARRQAAAYFMTGEAVTKLFDTWLRALATAKAATRALSARLGRRAMAPRRRSSNCSAASRCSTRSARSVPKPAPRRPKRPARRWKKPRPSKRLTPKPPAPRRKARKRKNSFRFDLV